MLHARLRDLLTSLIFLAATLPVALVLGCVEHPRGDGGSIRADNNGSRFGDRTIRPEDRIAPDGECGDALESSAMVLLNGERESAGLSTLACDLDMLEVARGHSVDMDERAFFDHLNPDGEAPQDRMNRSGLGGWLAVGENIADGQRTGAEVHAAWMGSPGHRANILHDGFTHAAVGIHRREDGSILWTQLFATF